MAFCIFLKASVPWGGKFFPAGDHMQFPNRTPLVSATQCLPPLVAPYLWSLPLLSEGVDGSLGGELRKGIWSSPAPAPFPWGALLTRFGKHITV